MSNVKNGLSDGDVLFAKHLEAIEESIATKIDGAFAENGYLYLTSNDEIVVGPLGPFAGTGGSGGGSANEAVITLTNSSGWLSKSIAYGASCPVTFEWSSIENELATGPGTVKVLVNGVTKYTADVEQGEITVDVSPYLSVGSNTVKVNVTDVYGNARTINYSITAISLSLASSFDATVAYEGEIAYTYTPTGEATKTMHYVLDGSELGTEEVTTSGRQRTYTIPAQTHGSHTFEVWFTAEADGAEIESNHLKYEIICIESLNTTPIITSSFDATAAQQYALLSIPYIVYNPASMTASVALKANDETVSEVTVDRTEQVWSYRPDEIGTLTLTITCGDTVKTFTVEVSESSITAEAETQNLALYLSAYGRSNNEANPSAWGEATLTDFNFASDGWLTDEDGATMLRVAGDARVEIPYQPFAQDFRTGGKTIEIEFATRDVMDYDAVVLSCWSGERGIKVTPQQVLLKSQQSELSRQYKEDEHVRIGFVVEKKSEQPLLCCYINGILSGVVKYPDDDDFSQVSPVGISIGHNDCTIDIYCIRVYDNNLTRYQMLDNWIADTQAIEDKIDRFTRNDVYDDYGKVVISKLPKDLPYFIMQGEELPEYKGDKETIDGSLDGDESNTQPFEYEGAEADVQGTSSQYYARKNYKVKFKGGFIIDGVVYETYQITDGSVPTYIFTLKADVASSEGANNVELARLYDDACPYQTPAQVDDPRVRQGIDGFPMVIFHYDGTDTVFLGKYNFNNDKGTPEVFGFTDDDESWEIKNNTSNRVLWKSADFSGTDWQNDFEARHPDGSTDVTNLKALAEWLVSTDQEQATGEAIDAVTYGDMEYTADTAEYRLAKFKAEFEDWFELDAMLFNYIFTELFLMVDNRAKNAFPTRFSGGKWIILPYDYDTAIGTNNEGALVFSYDLEDIDQTASGADVYNGQNSVLWVNLRQAFYDEIKAMYQELRSTKALSYEDTEARFEAHQAKWPEAIFNEDSWYKYLQPLEEDGDASYLSMLQGSKAEQRKWWLYNRFRYIDSKYNAGDALTDVITLRGYAKDNVTVAPYASVYAAVKYGSYLVQERVLKGGEVTLECPLDNVNDTEIYIYSASQLADVGDLSGFNVGYADFTTATKLQALKIGDSSESYSNANLTELYIGNCTLLRSLDVRNCPNLAMTVDVSGCTNLEHAYFDGTGITGLTLPNGGILKTLHLPETVTNLTVRNQKQITDFTMPSYANIATLRVENSSDVIDVRTILSAMAGGSRVRITGFDWTVESTDDILDFLAVLDLMRGLDENGNNVDQAQVSGIFRIDSITGAELAQIEAYGYTSVKVIYNHITSNLYYWNYDGSELLYTETVTDGGNGTYTGTPTRAADAAATYTFAGWSTQKDADAAEEGVLFNVAADRNVYAAYSKAIRYYTVWYYNDSTLLQTYTNVPYGGSVSYTGTTPEKGEEDYEFTGFSPDGTSITGDTKCYAQYKYTGSVARKLVARTLSGSYENDRVETIGNYAFHKAAALTSVSFPSVTSTGKYAFGNCSKLISANLPMLEISDNDDQMIFTSCSLLESVNIPKVEYLPTSIFANCASLKSIDLPSVTYIGTNAFYQCYSLTALVLRSDTLVTLSGSTALYNCYHILGKTNSKYNPNGLKDGYIYVPDDLVDSYKAATNWSTYADQIKPLSEYTGGE